jgi:hypothetical protein
MTSKSSRNAKQVTEFCQKNGIYFRTLFARRKNTLNYAMRSGASAHRAVRRRLLHLRRAIGCLSSSRGSSSTTSSRAGSSLTTSPMPCVRVPRHVAWLVVHYFASRGSSSATSLTSCLCSSLGSSSTTSPCAARRRLLHKRCGIGCLGSSRGSSSTTLPRTG